jgi:hypothetical protein
MTPKTTQALQPFEALREVLAPSTEWHATTKKRDTQWGRTIAINCKIDMEATLDGNANLPGMVWAMLNIHSLSDSATQIRS